MRVLRARIAALLTLLATALACTSVFAQTAASEPWPSRTVHIVVPSPGGSGIDLLARGLAQRLALQWAVPVVVDNRPGANSIIGTEVVARGPADGYTLLFASDATITVNPHLYSNLPYDPMRDFVPIAQVATFHQLLVAHPSLGARTFAELVQTARANPGAVSYASFGAGSSAHLLGEMLRQSTGTDLLHVPYKGFTQAVAAVLSGEVMLTWAGVFTTQAHVKAGRLRALAIAGPKRSPFLPDVPTLRELGHAEIEYTTWFGLFAPAATPRPVVERLHRDVARVLADPELRETELLARGYEPSALVLDAFAAHLRRELAARATYVKMSGAKVE